MYMYYIYVHNIYIYNIYMKVFVSASMMID